MNTLRWTSIFILLLFACGGYCDYQIVWSTLGGGGVVSSGGQYSVTATIGQPGTAASGGGNYQVSGGYWPGSQPLGTVSLIDFTLFSGHWLQGSCNTGNNWCSGADLDKLGNVNWTDLSILCGNWLAERPYDWPLQ
jgi:hypothetical protein